MKKILLFLFLFSSYFAFAQFQTPTVNGVIAGGEYANEYTVSGSDKYYITWNSTDLFVAVNFGNSTNDAINFYIDHNPISIVNGGGNTVGTLVGPTYDQVIPNLPFRADFKCFVK